MITARSRQVHYIIAAFRRRPISRDVVRCHHQATLRSFISPPTIFNKHKINAAVRRTSNRILFFRCRFIGATIFRLARQRRADNISSTVALYKILIYYIVERKPIFRVRPRPSHFFLGYRDEPLLAPERYCRLQRLAISVTIVGVASLAL